MKFFDNVWTLTLSRDNNNNNMLNYKEIMNVILLWGPAII